MVYDTCLRQWLALPAGTAPLPKAMRVRCITERGAVVPSSRPGKARTGENGDEERRGGVSKGWREKAKTRIAECRRIGVPLFREIKSWVMMMSVLSLLFSRYGREKA